MDGPGTTAGQVGLALDAYATLTSLAEEVEDEWSYVMALSESWQAALQDVADDRGLDPVAPETQAAIARVIDEVGRISDPHRAIDWLSTFPQVVLLALAGTA